jgi:hypothetical protein
MSEEPVVEVEADFRSAPHFWQKVASSGLAVPQFLQYNLNRVRELKTVF